MLLRKCPAATAQNSLQPRDAFGQSPCSPGDQKQQRTSNRGPTRRISPRLPKREKEFKERSQEPESRSLLGEGVARASSVGAKYL